MNTGEGSTPTACETSGKPARKRVTAPVPQPISSTLASLGKGDRREELVECAPPQKIGCAKLQRPRQAFEGRRVGSSNRSVNIGHFIFSHFALENAEQRHERFIQSPRRCAGALRPEYR